MAQQAWAAQDFMGWTPALDMRRTNQLFLLDGQNIAFTAAGPRSVFGNRLLLPHPIANPQHVQGIRIRVRNRDRVFIFTNDSILEWDENLGGWRVVSILPLITTAYRWTFGYLNGVIYFCHPRTGILELDLETEICQPIQGIGTPVAPLAIAVDNGRLVVLTDQVIQWSWQSNGRNFTPALGEAGAQRIAARVSGFPITLNSYGAGVIIFTTGGMLRGEFTGDQEVYRWRPVNTVYRPINSFCTLQTDENTVVLLDERGLFKSQGDAPTPHAPLFNEFLRDYLQKNRLKLEQNARIEFDEYAQQMYVSNSLSRYDAIYEQAWVVNPNLDKWGFMTEPHYGLVPINITTSIREGDYFGFVNSKGEIRYWRIIGTREAPTTINTYNLFYPVIQKPFWAEDGSKVRVCSSSMTFGFQPINPNWEFKVAGYYPRDGFEIAPAGITGLDSKLRVGLVKFDGLNESFDQMAEVIQVMIGNTISGPREVVGEDFNLIPAGVDDEDYNHMTGQESFGEEPMNYVNHGIRLIGTNDGKTSFTQEEPQLTLFNRAVRHYSCSVVGIWHILELTAESPGEALHLTSFELTATYAGRIA